MNTLRSFSISTANFRLELEEIRLDSFFEHAENAADFPLHLLLLNMISVGVCFHGRDIKNECRANIQSDNEHTDQSALSASPGMQSTGQPVFHLVAVRRSSAQSSPLLTFRAPVSIATVVESPCTVVLRRRIACNPNAMTKITICHKVLL